MKYFYTIIAIFTLPSCCFGDFVNIQVLNTTDNDLGLQEYFVYAFFNDPNDELFIAGNANITSTTGFFHNTINGDQASALPFTSAMTAMSDHPDADSFVTIGLASGDNNETSLAATFDEEAFIHGNNLGVDAAWANVNPFNDQGLAGEDGLVLIAAFTPLNDAKGAAGVVSGELELGYSDPDIQEPVSVTATFTTIPTPATLAVLGLGGVLGRLRRRR